MLSPAETTMVFGFSRLEARDVGREVLDAAGGDGADAAIRTGRRLERAVEIVEPEDLDVGNRNASRQSTVERAAHTDAPGPGMPVQARLVACHRERPAIALAICSP